MLQTKKAFSRRPTHHRLNGTTRLNTAELLLTPAAKTFAPLTGLNGMAKSDGQLSQGFEL